MSGNCDTCRHWEKMAGEQGGCRRYPPQYVVYTERAYIGASLDQSDVLRCESTFPQTKGTDWCGEWKADPRNWTPGPPPPRAPAPTYIEHGWSWPNFWPFGRK